MKTCLRLLAPILLSFGGFVLFVSGAGFLLGSSAALGAGMVFLGVLLIALMVTVVWTVLGGEEEVADEGGSAAVIDETLPLCKTCLGTLDPRECHCPSCGAPVGLVLGLFSS